MKVLMLLFMCLFIISCQKESDQPIAVFSIDSEIFETLDTIQFHNMSKYSDSFTWDFSDGTISHEKHPLHFYNSPGEYTIILTAKSNAGTDIFTLPVIVNKFKSDLIGTWDLSLQLFQEKYKGLLEITENRNDSLIGTFIFQYSSTEIKLIKSMKRNHKSLFLSWIYKDMLWELEGEVTSGGKGIEGRYTFEGFDMGPWFAKKMDSMTRLLQYQPNNSPKNKLK